MSSRIKKLLASLMAMIMIFSCGGTTVYAGEGDSGIVIKNETRNDKVVVLKNNNRSTSTTVSVSFVDAMGNPVTTAPLGDTYNIYIALRMNENLYHAIFQGTFSNGAYSVNVDNNTLFDAASENYAIRGITYGEESELAGLVLTNASDVNSLGDLYGYSSILSRDGKKLIVATNGQKYAYNGSMAV